MRAIAQPCERTTSEVFQAVKCLCNNSWASEGFFSRKGPLVDLNFFSGVGQKWWNFFFSHSKLRKQSFLLKFLKSRRAWPLCPPFPTPMYNQALNQRGRRPLEKISPPWKNMLDIFWKYLDIVWKIWATLRKLFAPLASQAGYGPVYNIGLHMIWSLKCCKCARIRFHCANVLVELRSCAS